MQEENGKVVRTQAIPAEVLTRFLRLYEKIRDHQKSMLKLLKGMKGVQPATSRVNYDRNCVTELENFQTAATTSNVQLLYTWGSGQWAEQLNNPAVSSVIKNLIYTEKQKIQELVGVFTESHKILMGFPPDGTFDEAINGVAEKIQSSWMGAASRADTGTTYGESLKQLRLLKTSVKDSQDKIRAILYRLERDNDTVKILETDDDLRQEISTLHTAITCNDIDVLRTWGNGQWASRLNETLTPDMLTVNTDITFARQTIVAATNKFIKIYGSLAPSRKPTLDAAIEHVKLLSGNEKKTRHWRRLSGA